MKLKILAFSDLHNSATLSEAINDIESGVYNELLEIIKECDIIVSLGDNRDIDMINISTLGEHFNIPFFGVLGNHDLDITIDNFNNVDGIIENYSDTILTGMEGSLSTSKMRDSYATQDESVYFADTLHKADILLSHDGPLYNGRGLKGVLHYIKKYNPKLVLHGHQHKTDLYYISNTAVVSVYGAIYLDIENTNIEIEEIFSN